MRMDEALRVYSGVRLIELDSLAGYAAEGVALGEVLELR